MLVRRAASREVGEKLLRRIDCGRLHRQERRFDGQQPVPGNKAGGLTTILEKSLGAVPKGGTTTCETSRIAEPGPAKGFVFMDTPGYDRSPSPHRRAVRTSSASPPAAAPPSVANRQPIAPQP